MPAAIPIGVQVAASAVATSVGLGGLATSAIVAGAGLLGSYVASKIIGKDANSYLSVLANMKLNTSTTQRTIPLVYGEHKVGSNDVFIEVTEGGTKYIYIVHCLGEGECEGISVDKDGKEQVFLNEKLASEYKSGLIEYWFHSGTNTQVVDPNISSVLDGKFTDPMVNTAYILFKIEYDNKVFSGVPSRTVVLKGLKLYDFRTELTIWSQNPVVILYDYLTNTRYGLGWSPTLLDVGLGSTWESAADYCDIDEPCNGKPRYYIDYYVGSQLKSQSIIETILSHFRGSISWFGGKIYLRYTDLRYEAPVFSIVDDHIARAADGKDMVSVSQPNSYGIPDGLVVKYFNKRNNWTLDDFPIGDSNGNIQQIMFNAFSDRGLAYEFGLYSLERSRLSKTISIVLRPNLIELDINDVGLLQSTELALEGQLVRVKESSITSDGLVSIVFVLETYNLYDSVYENDLSSVYSVDLASFSDPPPPIWNIVFDETLYYENNILYKNLEVTFDAPLDYPWFGYAEVYYKLDDVANEWINLFNTSGSFTVKKAAANALYFFKFVSVSSGGVRQEDEYAAYAQYQMSRFRGSPPSPTGITLVGNDLVIEGVPFSVDIWYEIRIGNITAGESSIFGEQMTTVLARSRNNVIPTGAMRMSNTLGGYNLWAATYYDNEYYGKTYCTTPYSTFLFYESEYARLLTYIGTNPISYFTGVHQGTYTVGNNLRLLKNSSYPKSGTYTTVEYNTGYIGNSPTRFYLDFFVSRFAAPDNTWYGVSGSNSSKGSSAWAECFVDLNSPYLIEKTWNYSVLEAGNEARVRISLLASSTSGGPYEEVVGLEARYAFLKFQYYKIKITLTDDSFGYGVQVTQMAAFAYRA